jgi:hypothetical protein
VGQATLEFEVAELVDGCDLAQYTSLFMRVAEKNDQLSWESAPRRQPASGARRPRYPGVSASRRAWPELADTDNMA